MPLSIRLPEDIEVRLERLAAQTGRSKTYYVTRAVCEHLDSLEDICLAERELAWVHAGKSTPTPLEVLLRHYGMEG